MLQLDDDQQPMMALAQGAAQRARDAARPLTVLSLGAGVQSTTMLLMGLERVLPRADLAIFADTGNEPGAVYQHLDWLIDHCRRTEYPVLVVSAGNITEDVLDALDSDLPTGQIGQPPFYVFGGTQDVDRSRPGRMWRKCTQAYKILPMRHMIRTLVGPGGHAESWIGISLDEKQRMRQNDVRWLVNRYPLVEARLTRHDCLLWLAVRGYPRPPKSSCIICPFHSDAYWEHLQRQAPTDFAHAVAFDALLKTGHLPGVHGYAYLHRSCQPLGDIDFTSPHEKAGQLALPLWGSAQGACEGACFT